MKGYLLDTIFLSLCFGRAMSGTKRPLSGSPATVTGVGPPARSLRLASSGSCRIPLFPEMRFSPAKPFKFSLPTLLPRTTNSGRTNYLAPRRWRLPECG